MSRNILFLGIIGFIVVIVAYCNKNPQEVIQTKVWEASNDSLSKKIYHCFNLTNDIQFYYPYRGGRLKSLIRIQYVDSIYFDFYKGELCFTNSISDERFNKYAQDKNINLNYVRNKIIENLNSLITCGIYSLTYTDSTTKIITNFSQSQQYQKIDSVVGFIFCKKYLSYQMEDTYRSMYTHFEKINSLLYCFTTKK